MPHLHRFYHPDAPSLTRMVDLSTEEAHHALRVLRVRPGDPVELFDGQGHTWTGAIAALSRSEVSVEISGETFTPRDQPGLALAQAWLHRDKVIDDIIRDATVLGVSRICFFRAAHSEKAPKLSPKWTRLMVESCKQCGRPRLPELTLATSLADALSHCEGATLAVAAMEGPHVPFSSIERERPVAYFVGPEGDFSGEEMSTLQRAGALPLSLGRYTLRSEAAASVGITLIQHHLGTLGA